MAAKKQIVTGTHPPVEGVRSVKDLEVPLIVEERGKKKQIGTAKVSGGGSDGFEIVSTITDPDYRIPIDARHLSIGPFCTKQGETLPFLSFDAPIYWKEGVLDDDSEVSESKA